MSIAYLGDIPRHVVALAELLLLAFSVLLFYFLSYFLHEELSQELFARLRPASVMYPYGHCMLGSL